jgi:serpin B
MAADARGERAFAAKLHAALVKAGGDATGNLFVSPASVRFAFALLHAGAKGQTASELASLFGYVPESAEVAGALASDWTALAAPAKEEWRRGEEVTIRSANRIFASKSAHLLPAYVTAARDRYGAPVDLLDFGGDPEGSRVAINRWVEQNTAGKIKDILAPRILTTETKIALANAIYFKAAWQRAFEVSDTLPGPFTTPKGKVTVPMMTQVGHGKVGDTSDAEVVELPYGRDFVMTIVLPKGQASLATLEGAISEEKLRAWASAPTETPKLRVTMPKFRVESTVALGETLKALGVTSAFAYGKSDFSGMDGTRELFVSAAIHKTFVAVDEKGTEAAAATVVSMSAGAAPDRSKPREVNVDRPFLFAIRDAKRDRLVFLGRVVDPSK